MLQPARRKYRKEQKGRNKGVATVGNKVWVFKGEVLAHNAEPSAPAPAPEAPKRPRRAGARNVAAS